MEQDRSSVSKLFQAGHFVKLGNPRWFEGQKPSLDLVLDAGEVILVLSVTTNRSFFPYYHAIISCAGGVGILRLYEWTDEVLK